MTKETFKEYPATPRDLGWLAENFKLADISSFTLEELFRFLPSLRVLEVPLHGIIVREAEEGCDLFVVYSGHVSVSKKKGLFGSVEVARLLPGTYFGEIGLFGGGVRKATVRAETSSRVFRVSAGELELLLERKQGSAELIKQKMWSRQNELEEVDAV